MGKVKKYGANRGSEYYLLVCDDTMSAMGTLDIYTDVDDGRFACGNYFLTEAEAQAAADRINLDLKIRKWQRENDGGFVIDVCDFDQKKYTFYYNVFEKDWSIMPVNRLLWTHYYFSCEEVAKQFISEFGVEFVRVFYGLVIGGDTNV